MAADPLPASFKSLYRLVLRATSASVLHRTVARKHVRRLWRPMFDAAAEMIRDMEDNKLPQTELHKREELLSLWQRRMDRTLTFLVTSATSRGLPHKVVRNMNLLGASHVRWVRGTLLRPKRVWEPQLPPKSPEYEPTPLIPEIPRYAKAQAIRRKNRQDDERCWDAFGEVVKMAEGRHNLSLGRNRSRPWTLESW